MWLGRYSSEALIWDFFFTFSKAGTKTIIILGKILLMRVPTWIPILCGEKDEDAGKAGSKGVGQLKESHLLGSNCHFLMLMQSI